MTTYMTHPEHGVHLAYSAEEIASCEKNGWKVHGENPPGLNAAVEPVVMESVKTKRKYTRRA